MEEDLLATVVDESNNYNSKEGGKWGPTLMVCFFKFSIFRKMFCTIFSILFFFSSFFSTFFFSPHLILKLFGEEGGVLFFLYVFFFFS